MQIKSAFAAAIAKYPELERRTALAMFIRHYTYPWPIADYRCVGQDAAIICEFLTGCGFKTPSDYRDIVSTLDPSAHQIHWVNTTLIKQFANDLATRFSAIEATKLYMTQLGLAPDLPTTGALADTGDQVSSVEATPAFWDPLRLYPATRQLAEELANGSDQASKSWAGKWLATKVTDRSITAPLWVLEAKMEPDPDRRLFTATKRSSSGSTAGVPFSYGRYVEPSTNVGDILPLAASLPVINTWGWGTDTDAHCSKSPLAGYMMANVCDLMGVPLDGDSNACKRIWIQIESAYVFPEHIGSYDKVKMLLHPKDLWKYIISLYENVYQRRLVLVPQYCYVHVGRAEDEDLGYCGPYPVSTHDSMTANGNRFEIRPVVLFLDELPDAKKSSNLGSLEMLETNFLSFVSTDGEANGQNTVRLTKSSKYLKDKDVAAEWYAMTCSNLNSRLTTPCRVAGGLATATAAFRNWIKGAHSSDESSAPELLDINKPFSYGYRAIDQLVHEIISKRTELGELEFRRPTDEDESNWPGSRPKLHLSRRPVPAIYSGIVAADTSVPDMTRQMTSDEVTQGLDALAKPALQLMSSGLPEADQRVQIVVETNFEAKDVLTGKPEARDMLLNAFLAAFQLNKESDCVGLSMLKPSPGQTVPDTFVDMSTELTSAYGAADWSSVRGGTESATSGPASRNDDWDAVLSSNKDDVTVAVQADSIGRLVIVFQLRVGSLAEKICRIAFRYFNNLPILTCEQMKVLLSLRPMIHISGESQEVWTEGLRQAIALHIAHKCDNVVPGWTDWKGPKIRGHIFSSPHLNRQNYREVEETLLVQNIIL